MRQCLCPRSVQAAERAAEKAEKAAERAALPEENDDSAPAKGKVRGKGKKSKGRGEDDNEDNDDAAGSVKRARSTAPKRGAGLDT